jgi:hypothetical protein
MIALAADEISSTSTLLSDQSIPSLAIPPRDRYPRITSGA